MGVYCTLYKVFHIFARGVQSSLAEQMPMQIAQDKSNVDQFLKYIVGEGSQINFVTRYICPMDILSNPKPVWSPEKHSEV